VGRGRGALLASCALVLWVLLLLRVFTVFGPETVASTVGYNSDAAIPVLMANDDRPFSVHSLYYYGTDHFGTWVLAIPAWIHRTTGLWWSDRMVFLLLATWVMVGVWVAGSLAPRDRWAVMVAYAVVLCLQRDSRYLLFHIGQLYGWLVTSLLFAWLGLRRLFDHDRAARSRPWLVRGAAIASMSLAMLSSIAALPYLLALLALEALRSFWGRDRRTWLRALGWASGLLGVAVLADRTLRHIHVERSLENLQHNVHVPVSLDTKFLVENASRLVESLVSQDWFWLYCVGWLGSLGLIVWSSRLLLRERGKGGKGIVALAPVLEDDTLAFALGAMGLSVLCFAFAVAADHVRINLYNPRYLAITHHFAPVGAVVLLYVVLERGLGTRYRRIGPLLVGAGLLALVVAMPKRQVSTYYETLQEISSELQHRAPGKPLLGGYWSTYVFASLQPESPMVPVPLDFSRTPWTIVEARQANAVIVEYLHSRLGTRGSPPPRIESHGLSLRLRQPRWLVADAYEFALYHRHPLLAGGQVDELLRDGFETGDTCAWSRTAGGEACP
jgi:hypothetical protein